MAATLGQSLGPQVLKQMLISPATSHWPPLLGLESVPVQYQHTEGSSTRGGSS